MCSFTQKRKDKTYTFNCGEQAMMAQKALLFEDSETFDKIMASNDPKEIKDLGRQVQNYKQDVWDAYKYKIMVNLSHARFYQNEYLRGILLSTGDKILVEASPYDTIWGIGMDADTARETPDEEWKGENLLGKALTEVKNRLRKEFNNHISVV